MCDQQRRSTVEDLTAGLPHGLSEFGVNDAPYTPEFHSSGVSVAHKSFIVFQIGIAVVNMDRNTDEYMIADDRTCWK